MHNCTTVQLTERACSGERVRERHSLTLSLSLSLSHSLSLTHTLSLSHSLSLTLSHTLSLSLSLTHTLTHSLARWQSLGHERWGAERASGLQKRCLLKKSNAVESRQLLTRTVFKNMHYFWGQVPCTALYLGSTWREFFIDNLLIRIHFIIVMIRWTGLAPWEFESPFPGSLASTFLVPNPKQ